MSSRLLLGPVTGSGGCSLVEVDALGLAVAEVLGLAIADALGLGLELLLGTGVGGQVG